jgi:type II restriction enzyme
MYCPNCGVAKINPFPNNSPVADFFCASCKEEFELKSQKSVFRTKVLDGAFRTKCDRLAASNNPSLFLLNYDRKQLSVVNLMVVPKHFRSRNHRRTEALKANGAARRLDRLIYLAQVPTSGKIFIVRDGQPAPKENVLAQWKKTLFLRNEGLEARGWLIEVMKCVEAIGRLEFDIDDIYAFESHLGRLYPGNQNVKPKIRQQLQYLRDRGYLDFVSRGRYRLRSQI